MDRRRMSGQTTNMLIFLASGMMLAFFDAIMLAMGHMTSTDWRIQAIIWTINVGVVTGLVVARVSSTLGS